MQIHLGISELRQIACRKMSYIEAPRFRTTSAISGRPLYHGAARLERYPFPPRKLKKSRRSGFCAGAADKITAGDFSIIRTRWFESQFLRQRSLPRRVLVTRVSSRTPWPPGRPTPVEAFVLYAGVTTAARIKIIATLSTRQRPCRRPHGRQSRRYPSMRSTWLP